MPPGIQEMTREELLSVVGEQYSTITIQQHRIKELQRLIFGAKSERFVPAENPQQTELDFGEALVQPESIAETATEVITYEREKSFNKAKPSRQPIPEHLPRITHEIQPEEEVTGLVKIGEEVTEELEYTPGKLFVNRYVRPKYVKPSQEGNKIITGKLPERPLPKCIAGPNLLAALITAKFIDHLPLYRQAQMFKRQGIELSDSTLGGWVSAVAKLLQPLYEAQKKKILSASYLQADETPIEVLESEKSGSTHRGYHWVYQDPEKRLVFFDYRQGRGREGPEEILKNFTGHLQTDGYGVYDNFGKRAGITQLHCWAHARRKFSEAEDSDRTRAHYVLAEIQKLYAIEKEIREQALNEQAILKLRQEKSLPVIDDLQKWMLATKTGVLPKSPMGKAIEYTLSRIETLKVYTTHSALQIDNNLTENAIRPVALGRKNYLFAGSHQTAQHAAIFYSLFATCKANNINPQEWLTATLQKIASHPINRIEELLPA
jgi:transposase